MQRAAYLVRILSEMRMQRNRAEKSSGIVQPLLQSGAGKSTDPGSVRSDHLPEAESENE